MRSRFLILIVVLLSLLVLPLQAQESTITLTNAPSETFTLAVGETYTFNIVVESAVPFVSAAAMPSSYFPGRGVFWAQPDHAQGGTSANLAVTMTGKNSTNGEALPVYLYVAVRYQGGVVEYVEYHFNVIVP